MASKSKFQRSVRRGEVFTTISGRVLKMGDIMLDIRTKPDPNEIVLCKGCVEPMEVVTPGWEEGMPFSRHCPNNDGALRFAKQSSAMRVTPEVIERGTNFFTVKFTFPR